MPFIQDAHTIIDTRHVTHVEGNYPDDPDHFCRASLVSGQVFGFGFDGDVRQLLTAPADKVWNVVRILELPEFVEEAPKCECCGGPLDASADASSDAGAANVVPIKPKH